MSIADLRYDPGAYLLKPLLRRDLDAGVDLMAITMRSIGIDPIVRHLIIDVHDLLRHGFSDAEGGGNPLIVLGVNGVHIDTARFAYSAQGTDRTIPRL